MWFSPWRRILRGRSGDAKPSGLRAGTKFVEEDTGVEYTYDPVMKDWKKKVAPYSAIVCKDGSTVWAEDFSGKTIASGEAGVDDASVIQSALNNRGAVILRQATYKCNSTLIIKSGTSLIGEGGLNFYNPYKTMLDFSGAGDVPAIKFDDPDVGRVQGGCLKNLIIWGNTTTKQGTGLYLNKLSNGVFRNIDINYFKRGLYVLEGWNIYYDNLAVNACGDTASSTSAILLDGGTDDTNHQIFVGLQGGGCEYIVFETTGACSRNHLIAPTVEMPKDGISKGFVFNEGAYFRMTNIDLLMRGEVGIQIENKAFIKIVCGKIDCNGYNYGIINKSWQNCSVIGVDIYAPAAAGIYNTGALSVHGGYIYGTGASDRGIYNDSGEIRLYGAHVTFFNKEAFYSFRGKVQIFGGRFENASIETAGAGSVIKLANVEFAYIKAPIIYVDPENNSSWAFEIQNCTDVLIDEAYAYGNLVGFITEPESNTNLRIRVKNANHKYYNSGVATFSGDGVAKVFEIGAHGLVTTDPSKIAVRVTPASSDAIAASPCVGYVDPVDNTKIKVKFSSPPDSGANNVQIVWHAEVVS